MVSSKVTPWRKATKSGGSGGGGCAEVRRNGHVVEMRDSKNPDGPVLTFTPHEWACFMDGAKKDEFSDLI